MIRIYGVAFRMSMAGFGYRRLNSDRSQLQEIFLEPYLQAFRPFFAFWALDSASSSGIVELRRELSHRELPDGELPAPAIIVSFGVAAHWRLRKRGDSAAGIDSWQRVVKQRYLVSPSRFETPRSVPVTGDRAVAIFSNCSTAREAVVCPYRSMKFGFAS